MNVFLSHLLSKYPNDYIVLVCDGAAWHKSKELNSFHNIELLFIPPYTPEMNPIEQIWKELRARGFHNEVFQTLAKVLERLCETICNLTQVIFIGVRIVKLNIIIGNIIRRNPLSVKQRRFPVSALTH